MKKIVFILSLIQSCVILGDQHASQMYDVTVAGYILFANGLGRITISALDLFQDSLKVNFKATRQDLFSMQNVPEKVQALLNENNQNSSNVAILYDCLSVPNRPFYKHMPDSGVKLAYSMVEQTEIPPVWTSIINNHLDGVVVPDPFLVDVYKNSGVVKPIFVVPLPVYLGEFLDHPVKTKPNQVFTFGISCSLSPHKNCELLVDAFLREFKNAHGVKLKIHSLLNNAIAKRIKKKIKKLNAKNIELHTGSLPWADYIRFMSSLDCYVLISKGEGFSITPREALALGIPCILSNNSAHKTICDSGYVYAVKSEIKEKHIAEDYGVSCGYNFNCKIEDVQKALREVYGNYNHYLSKAQEGREWVKRYLAENLQPLYTSLVKPRKIVLGQENIITEEHLVTSDEKLYRKYLSFLTSQEGVS